MGLKKEMIRKIAIFLLTAMFLFPAFGMKIKAAIIPEMKLHVILLKDKSGNVLRNGDAVLLESKGKYLLMDTGSEKTVSSVITYLKKNKVKKLDIYLSHIHEDHYGGLKAILSNAYFSVGKVYLPYRYGSTSPTVKNEYNHLKKLIKDKKKMAVYLKINSTFSVGDAKGKVIGSIGNYNKSDMLIWQFRNNYSLCSMITCGKVKYLSCGDIHKEEEAKLVKKYGAQLKADIMKASHHGAGDSTSNAWLKKVQPRYVFASADKEDSWTKDRIIKFADYRVTGVLRKTLIYTIKNNRITLK